MPELNEQNNATIAQDTLEIKKHRLHIHEDIRSSFERQRTGLKKQVTDLEHTIVCAKNKIDHLKAGMEEFSMAIDSEQVIIDQLVRELSPPVTEKTPRTSQTKE